MSQKTSQEQSVAEQLDVVIVGAGISGIGMAHALLQQKGDSNYSFAVVEGRANIGGTWDFFKYPGLRSDSDMYSFAYSFKPWRHCEYIGSADRILGYLDEVIQEHHVDEYIRFNTRIIAANWDSNKKRWVLTAKRGDGGQYTIEAKFFISCTGYYNYEHGYRPAFPDEEAFQGDIIHPQKWPENYDYSDKDVVVIGSGATAFTIVPEMSSKTKSMTMLQRSPSYVYNRPASDGLFRFLDKFLPAKLVNRIMRIKYICLQQFAYGISKLWPKSVKKIMMDDVRKAVDNKLDVDKHFNPDYAPWDQRVCMVPDNDLFEAVKRGDANVVTGHIERFTKNGILLKDGQELPADLIVTATGLDLQLWGGMDVKVDNMPVDASRLTNYKGMMFNDLPNMVYIFGYTNTSWTVKAELTYGYVCRLLKLMQQKGYNTVYPHQDEVEEPEGIVGLQSGYIMRSQHKLPKQGKHFPWRNKDFYFADLFAIKHSTLEDGILVFNETSHLADFHGSITTAPADTNSQREDRDPELKSSPDTSETQSSDNKVA